MADDLKFDVQGGVNWIAQNPTMVGASLVGTTLVLSSAFFVGVLISSGLVFIYHLIYGDFIKSALILAPVIVSSLLAVALLWDAFRTRSTPEPDKAGTGGFRQNLKKWLMLAAASFFLYLGSRDLVSELVDKPEAMLPILAFATGILVSAIFSLIAIQQEPRQSKRQHLYVTLASISLIVSVMGLGFIMGRGLGPPNFLLKKNGEQRTVRLMLSLDRLLLYRDPKTGQACMQRTDIDLTICSIGAISERFDRNEGKPTN